MTIGFALCGSFCTYSLVFPVMEELVKEYTVIPIFSSASYTSDTRFGSAQEHIQRAQQICQQEIICSINDAEPIGPKKLLDALIIAPCTGNTLAKLAHSIADGPVTMAAKSHLRNEKPVLIAVSSNDALAGTAENIGKLLGKRNFYFVPFGQDDPVSKPRSMVADFQKIPPALKAALEGRQIQPIIF